PVPAGSPRLARAHDFADRVCQITEPAHRQFDRISLDLSPPPMDGYTSRPERSFKIVGPRDRPWMTSAVGRQHGTPIAVAAGVAGAAGLPGARPLATVAVPPGPGPAPALLAAAPAPAAAPVLAPDEAVYAKLREARSLDERDRALAHDARPPFPFAPGYDYDWLQHKRFSHTGYLELDKARPRLHTAEPKLRRLQPKDKMRMLPLLPLGFGGYDGVYEPPPAFGPAPLGPGHTLPPLGRHTLPPLSRRVPGKPRAGSLAPALSAISADQLNRRHTPAETEAADVLSDMGKVAACAIDTAFSERLRAMNISALTEPSGQENAADDVDAERLLGSAYDNVKVAAILTLMART
ncbi:uncharacterized protein V1510DRAFT_434403, partial [Dipodascopsis tothii]|uniref:uncharacterized protein n=1 Tax=Dipodascopsis tothii TaxID=44089 RepID=UPI0034CF9EAC